MAGIEGGGTLSKVYHSAMKLLLRARDKIERLERFESSVSREYSRELSFSVKKDISQIHSLCAIWIVSGIPSPTNPNVIYGKGITAKTPNI
ncbi:hypothetical protein F3Y22_tig00111427pilonHSYRG00246 [Hibiscus syriacus]|uniref:Uncharacterized protein n=1 Tax=Hibiscus syriacus TaxID=106335 RepID=A0A6A2Y3H1_HIBSY|nr:hypothetical protein F3Y22_tig00111427pilonHSYRG00246 [Hibiscus syriacus]